MPPNKNPRPYRINIGCGATPTPEWSNFDNSLTVRLAGLPGLIETLAWTGLASTEAVNFARVARASHIRYADAARRIPLPDESAEVVYSSHMIEHLDPKREVPKFLSEVRRILLPGGLLRIAIPDLLRQARRYLQTGDADEFIASLNVAGETPRGTVSLVRYLLVGFRQHRWMYDASSFIRVVEANGFSEAREVPPGETMVSDPGALNLLERAGESVYIEARRAESPRASWVARDARPVAVGTGPSPPP